MRKLVSLLTAMVLAISLSACAGMHHEKEKTMHVKCPACGYEFNVPVPHGGP